MHRMVRQR